jgi:hypothetical protein
LPDLKHVPLELVGIGESDALEQEIEPIIPRQEDKFPAEANKQKGIELPLHRRYRALSTCYSCINAVQVP